MNGGSKEGRNKGRMEGRNEGKKDRRKKRATSERRVTFKGDTYQHNSNRNTIGNTNSNS